MSVPLTALRNEIQNDPAGLGYAAMVAAGADGAIAEALNEVRAGAPYAIYRTDVPVQDVVAAIAPADFTALTAIQLSRLQLLFLGGLVNAANTNTRQILQAIFSGASAGTVAAMAAVATRQGSRAEVLWGANAHVTADDVAWALRPRLMAGGAGHVEGPSI